jgi:hypothetical protein
MWRASVPACGFRRREALMFDSIFAVLAEVFASLLAALGSFGW